MTSYDHEKRNHFRHDNYNENLLFRVYTSIKPGAYSVEIQNISEGGAFIRSKHLPQQNEQITFEILDDLQKMIHSGNAQVSWLKTNVAQRDKGFGITFHDGIDVKVLNLLQG